MEDIEQAKNPTQSGQDFFVDIKRQCIYLVKVEEVRNFCNENKGLILRIISRYTGIKVGGLEYNELLHDKIWPLVARGLSEKKIKRYIINDIDYCVRNFIKKKITYFKKFENEGDPPPMGSIIGPSDSRGYILTGEFYNYIFNFIFDKVSLADYKIFEDYYKNGLTDKEIAEKWKCVKSTVQLSKQKVLTVIRKHFKTKEDLEEYIELCETKEKRI